MTDNDCANDEVNLKILEAQNRARSNHDVMKVKKNLHHKSGKNPQMSKFWGSPNHGPSSDKTHIAAKERPTKPQSANNSGPEAQKK